MAQWFRLWHGTASDPKLAAAAVRARVSRAEVLAIWVSLLEHASQNDPRGRVSSPAEDIAVALAMEIEAVERTITALEGKGLIVDQRIAAWDKRQPQREDMTATERSKRFRAKRNADATPQTGDATAKTGDATHQNRTEQSRADPPYGSPPDSKLAKPPIADDPALPGEEGALTWMGDEASADRQLRWLGAILDDLPERDRKPVTDFTRMATNGRTLTTGQIELLATLFQRHRVAIVDESNRRLAKRFPDLIEAMKHPKHGREVAAAAARRDDRELDRLLKIVRDDITSPPPFLRRGAAA